MTVEFGGKAVKVPVTVKDAKVDRPIWFKLDVMPVFMRAGCNTGSCHGAARGKDGFRLSLFGFDPDGDHYRLTREINGRRINLAVPAESLLMEKATGKVPHTGGKRFKEGDELLQDAHPLARGRRPARRRRPSPSRSRVELYPEERRARRQGRDAADDRPGQVLRRHRPRRDQPGRVPDATTTTRPRSSPDGLVTAGERGEAFVMARFATFTVGSQVIVLPKGLQFDVPARAREQLHRHAGRRQAQEAADRPVAGSAPTRRSSAASTSTSSACCRRPRSTTGSWPTRPPNKREQAGRRAARPQGVRRDVGASSGPSCCRSGRRNQVSYKAMLLYYNWLQDKIAKNVPMDEMVQELLGANGGTFKNPATNYYQIETRHAEGDRERRPGLHGHAHPVRPVPQPPVRPLDDGRLLRLRRVLRPDRPQGRRGLPRDDRLQLAAAAR